MTTSITIGNFKGGVGKTTTCVTFSYLLNKAHRKTLLIDFDPQGNASEIIEKTFPVFKQKNSKSLTDGIKNLDLSESIAHVTDYLDLMPSDWSLSLLPDMLEDYKKSDRPLFLKTLLTKIRNDYDYILIDVPPTLSAYTNNAVLASDYVIMVMQTQEQSYSSSLKFVSYLQGLRKDYDKSFDLLGIIAYLVKKDGPVDHEVLKAANQAFGKALFHGNVFQRERVKRFGKVELKMRICGTKGLYMYQVVLDEALSRINLLEE
ncbi:AAA family ATPase [Lactiplantibacillus plantarum]|nr:ParA family protein [Lactiplantibacillus plantarum]MBO2705910.1 AAA family ATPase [Lactiplantibacillus plantarum]